MHTAPPPPRRMPRGSVEQRVDLLDARLDRDELGASLDDETGVEAVALVHLERQAAKVAEALLADFEEGLPLALQLARRRNDVCRSSSSCPCWSAIASRLELQDDETLFGHLAHGVRRTLARVARVLDASVRHLVGAERRRLVDRHAAELELASSPQARP